jgi:hypothetical protein
MAQVNQIMAKMTRFLEVSSRVISRKKAVQSTDDTKAKLNALADLTADAAYLSALSVAIDQNDPTIMRKLKIK